MNLHANSPLIKQTKFRRANRHLGKKASSYKKQRILLFHIITFYHQFTFIFTQNQPNHLSNRKKHSSFNKKAHTFNVLVYYIMKEYRIFANQFDRIIGITQT